MTEYGRGVCPAFIENICSVKERLKSRNRRIYEYPSEMDS